MAGIICTQFKPHQSGSLMGFADLLLPSGIKILGATLHESHDKRWVGMPAKPQLDHHGNPVRDQKNKIQYTMVVHIPDEARRRAFSEQAVRAINRFVADQTDATGQQSDASPLI